MKPARRALIVDDDALMRDELRKLLLAHPEIEVVGEAAGVIEAIERFNALNPDLIFLDVQMPKRNGFSLLPELYPVPDIIFITAFDAFAVKAFEVNAVDFLLKPIHPERLKLALSRLARPIKRKAKPFTRDDAIFLYSDREMRIVSASEITFIESEHNYTRVHLVSHKAVLVRRKISEWNRLLPSELLWRVDRFTIINLPAIKEIRPEPRQQSAVHFHGSPDIAQLRLFASRRLRKAIRQSGLAKPLETPKV